MANIFKSKFTGEQIEEILDKANNVTDIQANNGEATTEDLQTLKIGDVNYKIPEQTSEGVNVVANPNEEATAELTKIKIDNTVYSLPEQSPTDTQEEAKYYLTVSAAGLGSGADKHFSSFINKTYQQDTVKGLINATPMVTDGTYLFKLVATDTTVKAYQYNLSSLGSPTIKSLGTLGMSIRPEGLTLTSLVRSDVSVSVYYGAGGGSD